MLLKLNLQRFANTIPDVSGATTIKIKFKDTLTLTTFNVSVNFKVYIDEFTTEEYVGIKCENSKSLVYVDSDGGEYEVYDTGHWTLEYQVIEIDPTQTNFQAFITAMKDNIKGVELEAGTYKWGISDVGSDINSSFELNFVSNSTNYSNLNITTELKFLISYVNSSGSIIAYNTGTWNNNNYKTIVVETAQYVPYDFYNYAILGNQLVKQGGSGGTNKLKFGTETPTKLYIGDTEVTKAYLGDTLVYEK